jgi:hypothetical protein
MTQIDGNVSYGHELEELILLKSQYHPKQSKNSVQSLSKSQCHFASKMKKILKFISNHKIS